jgi:hypothetical protein
MASICTSNLTSGFIDLATYDEQERYLYGSDAQSFTYFVREHHKATWFTQVPVVLSRASGTPDFNGSNQEWSVTISRAGDYLLQTWLRVTLPQLTPVAGIYARWTNNVGHNLIRECCVTFNDLVAARFDNYHLDFWAAFTVPDSKYTGYQNMIGNVDALTQPAAVGTAKTSLPSYTLNIPLPFFFSRDTGVALPTAALPYNDMKINFSFRSWEDLIEVYTGPLPTSTSSKPTLANFGLSSAPNLTNVCVWANYAIVANDERKKMACAARDILIEQVQTAPISSYSPATNSQPVYDIRFSHAIKSLYFAVRNRTNASEWSNYTTLPLELNASGVILPNPAAVDPIGNASLIYENTQRLYQMGADYFSLVQPWYTAPRIPTETGYHLYSYSLDLYCLDPMGSTNYGKLTNVSIIPAASDAAKALPSQTYDFIVTAVNNNIVRIAGGTLGKNGKPKIGSCNRSCGNTLIDKQYNFRSTALVC